MKYTITRTKQGKLQKKMKTMYTTFVKDIVVSLVAIYLIKKIW